MSTETIILANGCFWCTEAVFASLKGVISVMPGYTGGTTPNPTDTQVYSGKTGHAESLKIEYDPAGISFKDLLTVFFATHDPTTLNRQGGDVGTQYRSGIYYMNEQQKQESLAFIQKLNEEGPKVVTELKAASEFYPAEEYHRNYYTNNADAPYCQVVISPKLKKLNERFSQLLKESN
jgi:peptide-methionine (S)-S-oxide reductase